MKTIIMLIAILTISSSFAASRYSYCDLDGWRINYNGEMVTYKTECFKTSSILGSMIAYKKANNFCSGRFGNFIDIPQSARDQNVPFANDFTEKERCVEDNGLESWINGDVEYDVLKIKGIKVYRFYVGPYSS